MTQHLTPKELSELDQKMSEKHHVSVLQLMEVAGFQLAQFCYQLLQDKNLNRVLIACGKGNNAGDGLVAARYLHHWGVEVMIGLVYPPDQLHDIPYQQFKSAQSFGIIWRHLQDNFNIETDMLIDGILGCGLSGPPKKEVTAILKQLNTIDAIKVAIDLPSGLNGTTGDVYEECFIADHTLTFVAPKTGFTRPSAKGVLGQVTVVDIGVSV